jgi:hypothetical protein
MLSIFLFECRDNNEFVLTLILSNDNDISDGDIDDHESTEPPVNVGSLSRQFRQIIERIQSRTHRSNTVQSRNQQQLEQEEQTVADLMCQQVKMISIQPLLFSVPYGHRFETDRCFVYLGRDTMSLRCDCSEPFSSSMYIDYNYCMKR